MRFESRELAVEFRHGRRDESLVCKKTRIVDEKAGGEIVRAVCDDVVARDDVERIVGSETDGMKLHLRTGIDALRRFGSGLRFGPADIARAIGDLALQIGE